MQEKKKILCPMDWFFLIVAIAIIGYIVMKNYNISILEKTESIEIIDRPHSPDRIGKPGTPQKDK